MINNIKDKAAWIADARKTFRPGSSQPCCFCGKHESIAHAHHKIPLARQYRIGLSVPIHDHVWLCPSHHAAVHLLIDQASGKRVGASGNVILLINELTEDGCLSDMLALVEDALMPVSKMVEMIRKSASARMAHADALEAEGLDRSAA